MEAIIDYRGKTPKKTTSGVPLITAKIVKDGRLETPFEYIAENDYLPWMRRGFPKLGDVVMTTEAPLGEVAQLSDAKVALAQRVIILRGKPGVLDNTFLKFLLRSARVQERLHARASGSTVSGIRQSELRKVLLPLPTIGAQRAIAGILGALDDKIDLNRKLTATLEATARALFKSWFVDFDPVHAKAEDRDPGLPREIAALFPDSFEEKRGGIIPNGWTLGSLFDITQLNPESWSKDTRPDTLRYVDLSTVKWGRIQNFEVFERDKAPSRAQRVLRVGDTVVGTVRPGNGSYALIGIDGLTGSTGFAVLRPTKSKAYTYLAATARQNIERLQHLADGGAYPAVRPDVVSATVVVLPSDKILACFSELANPLLDRYLHAEGQTRTLGAIRDALLPKLISGELRVSDAERILEKSA